MRALPALFLLAACAPTQAPSRPAAGVGSPSELPMRMVGTEPFWGARLSLTQITLSGVDRPERSFGPPGQPYPGSAGAVYVVPGGRFRVGFGPCSDGMSDRVYPYVAEVEVGAERLKGCAIPERLWGPPQP